MILLSDNKRLALVGAYDNREGHFGLDCSNAILNGKLLSTNVKHGYAYMVENIQECIDIIKTWANEVDLGRNYKIEEVGVPAITADGWYLQTEMLLFDGDENYYEVTCVGKDHNIVYEVIWTDEDETDYDWGEKRILTDAEIGKLQCY